MPTMVFSVTADGLENEIICAHPAAVVRAIDSLSNPAVSRLKIGDDRREIARHPATPIPVNGDVLVVCDRLREEADKAFERHDRFLQSPLGQKVAKKRSLEEMLSGVKARRSR